ncbi:hypothetical protein [Spirosoma fluviale]|uniref:Carbohydrate binding domain-containing protein n=1 Tax=Spirosoma fluviale TaxID=1597977 RepID=A0A286GBA9_9BACT|nr:hypothetical protein [Spirosoma fluviale]SOD92790.1 hypothetical protein SAMN06269250_4166 [Spirosoma fluviale]
MKNHYYLLVLFVCSLFAYACKKEDTQPQTVANIVTNGDMEAAPYADWGSYLGRVSTTSPNKYTIEYSTEAASSPTHSIKVSCDAVKNDTTYQYLQQIIYTSNKPIPAGAKLTLRAKIKVVNVQGNGISLAMGGNEGASGRYASAFYTSTEGKIAITGTNDFKEYALTFDSFPAKATSMYVLLAYLHKTTGTVYFDDVSLSIN